MSLSWFAHLCINWCREGARNRHRLDVYIPFISVTIAIFLGVHHSDAVRLCFNPLRAFRPRGEQGPVYSSPPITRQLMTWRCKFSRICYAMLWIPRRHHQKGGAISLTITYRSTVFQCTIKTILFLVQMALGVAKPSDQWLCHTKGSVMRQGPSWKMARQLGGYYCLGTRWYLKSSPCNSTEDRAPVDKIYTHPIFKFLTGT